MKLSIINREYSVKTLRYLTVILNTINGMDSKDIIVFANYNDDG